MIASTKTPRSTRSALFALFAFAAVFASGCATRNIAPSTPASVAGDAALKAEGSQPRAHSAALPGDTSVSGERTCLFAGCWPM